MKTYQKISAVLALCLLGITPSAFAAAGSWSDMAAQKDNPPAFAGRAAAPSLATGLGNGVTHLTLESEFRALIPQPTEDNINNSLIGSNSVCSNPPPLSAATNDGCFAAGDLQPGYNLDVIPNGGSGQYVLLTTGFLGVPTNVIGPNTFAEQTEFNFSPPVSAFGGYLHGDVVGTVTGDFELFDAGDNSLGTVQVTGTLAGQFFGFVSSNAKIARITFIESTANGELFSGLLFGNLPAAVPSLGTWAILLLGGLIVLLGLGVRRRTGISAS